MITSWDAKRLDQLCAVFADGDWIESKDQSSTGIRLVQTGNIGSGIFKDRSEKARYISDATFKRLRCTELEAGDCLVSRLPDPVGRACLFPELPERAITAVDCTIIRFDAAQILPEYFVYFSQSIDYAEQVARLTGGATRQRISRKNLGQIAIPLPTVEEQRRIVAVLDGAFAAIATATANAEKNLANALELFSGELRQLFSGPGASWEWKALGDIADARLGKMLDKGKNKGTPHPYLRNLNVRWFEFDLSDMLKMRFEETEQERYTAIQGDLLIVEGGYPGRCAIWEGSEPIYFQKAIHRVRFSDPRLSKIFMYMLFAQNNDGSLKRHFSGAGIQHLTGQSLAKIRVPLPPTHERDAIVTRVEDLFAISQEAQDIYRSKLVQLEALKQSLLYRAFSGELKSKAAAIAAQNDNYATPEFAAKIVAFAYERHVAKNRARNFGTVKAEKILHMVEAIGGIDLGRRPLREAAGPDDAKHRHATWDWARSQHFFRFNKRSSGGHDFEKLSSYSGMIEDARTAIAGTPVEKAIELLVDMDRDFAELIATTYAAWNNLIIDQCAATDGDIVLAARDKWHRDKLRFDPSRFHDAIRFIRSNGIVPVGSAKRVGGQEALLL